MGRERNHPLYENVVIAEIGAEGKSIAKIDDLVIFTTQGIPGDVVDLQVTRRKKKYQEARIVRYHKFSEKRILPFCTHFGICGGCKWQQLPYNEQLIFKQRQVEDQLTRIGKLQIPPMTPILGSENTTFYRNKLEFTFSNNRWLSTEEIQNQEMITNRNALGFHIPGLFDKVIPIEYCWLQPEPSNKIRNFIFDYAIKNELSFFDIKRQQGFLRTLIVRTSSTGEVMVIVSFFEDDTQKRETLLRALALYAPEITSLLYVINTKGNDTITDREIQVFAGNDHIWETMEGLRFKIGPKSFYQTNSEQAYVLYKVVREFA
ncbi:MAG: 23S rRNA (uracil-5-)-methyltransferase RumA, partial [Prolixibacteraceae bacterium]|nr:23S rRNA (uracil-5-)-methyltransferase RumA [Prolixibacteraceae bacterium]